MAYCAPMRILTGGKVWKTSPNKSKPRCTCNMRIQMADVNGGLLRKPKKGTIYFSCPSYPGNYLITAAIPNNPPNQNTSKTWIIRVVTYLKLDRRYSLNRGIVTSSPFIIIIGIAKLN